MIWYPRPWLRKPSANGSKPFPHLPGVVRQPQVSFRRNDSTRSKKTARLMEYILLYMGLYGLSPWIMNHLLIGMHIQVRPYPYRDI